jgi:tripartite-type tricarboxylate transporter receptor subunit TctC
MGGYRGVRSTSGTLAGTCALLAVALVASASVAWGAEFPVKGKPINIIVGAAAGGPNDVAARMLAPLLEKHLGTPVQVINRPGAGWQVGTTELTRSKPDGHTIGYAPIPSIITLYLNPDRKAVFGRKDFQMLAMHVVDPGAIAVRSDSPYRSVRDLVEAARANPGKIKVSHTGIMGDDHLAILQFEKLTGASFAVVSFNSSTEAQAALLGGHIDVDFDNVGTFPAHVKAGAMRVLGIMDKEETRYYPGVKTVEAQGYKLYSSSARSIVMPAGASKEVISILSGAIKKATEDPEHRRKLDEMAFPLRYMGPEETAAFWDQMEAQVKPLLEAVSK